jgi:hypothetical protein
MVLMWVKLVVLSSHSSGPQSTLVSMKVSSQCTRPTLQRPLPLAISWMVHTSSLKVGKTLLSAITVPEPTVN